jgi:RimJ/RimL family protein N-acetyltransferase
MIPVLETERMILRAPTLEDFPAHAAIWADPRTTQQSGGFIYDEEVVWLRFQRHLGQWAMFGYGSWGVQDRQSGRYIGMMGFFNAHRAVDVPYRDRPEAGWMIAPDRHGQGLAREGLTAVLAWFDTHIAAPETWCMIHAGNENSSKLAARFGYRPAQQVQHRGKPVVTYLRPRGGMS